jgi:hypothetical protein
MADAAVGEELARAHARIDADLAPFDRALAGVRAQLGAIEDRFASLSRSANVYLAGVARQAAGALADGLGHVINAASDLQESTNKAKTVFGDSFGTIQAEVDRLADSFGVVRSQAIDATANLGQFAQGMGQTEAESARFANTFTQLALDLKSFNNASIRSFDEAMTKIRAGLAGETEPLMQFGVDLRENTVQQFAWARGIAAAGRELSGQEKMTARAALIQERLGKVSGDMARTIGDFANSSQAAAGRAENLAAAVGTALLPAFTDWQNLVNEVLVDFTRASDGMRSKMDQLAGAIRAGVNSVSSIWRNWDLILERAGVQLVGWGTNVQEVVAWVGASFGAFLDWIGANFLSVFADAFEAVLTAMGNFKDNFLGLAGEIRDYITSAGQDPIEFKLKPILEGFEAKTPELVLPDLKLSDVGAELARIDKLMTDNEVKAIEAREKAQAKEGDRKKGAAKVDEAARQKEQKPEFVGLAEFARKIQGGIGGDKTADRTARATERTAVAAERMAERIQAGGNRNPGFAVGPA